MRIRPAWRVVALVVAVMMAASTAVVAQALGPPVPPGPSDPCWTYTPFSTQFRQVPTCFETETSSTLSDLDKDLPESLRTETTAVATIEGADIELAAERRSPVPATRLTGDGDGVTRSALIGRTKLAFERGTYDYRFTVDLDDVSQTVDGIRAADHEGIYLTAKTTFMGCRSRVGPCQVVEDTANTRITSTDKRLVLRSRLEVERYTEVTAITELVVRVFSTGGTAAARVAGTIDGIKVRRVENQACGDLLTHCSETEIPHQLSHEPARQYNPPFEHASATARIHKGPRSYFHHAYTRDDGTKADANSPGAFPHSWAQTSISLPPGQHLILVGYRSTRYEASQTGAFGDNLWLTTDVDVSFGCSTCDTARGKSVALDPARVGELQVAAYKLSSSEAERVILTMSVDSMVMSDGSKLGLGKPSLELWSSGAFEFVTVLPN